MNPSGSKKESFPPSDKTRRSPAAADSAYFKEPLLLRISVL